MKQKIFLITLLAVFSVAVIAQKKSQNISAYAITSPQKGDSKWNEVRLVDINTGGEIQTVYLATQAPELLNARTGKPIIKTETTNENVVKEPHVVVIRSNNKEEDAQAKATTVRYVKTMHSERVQFDKPFSTNSAACAYDKKHDRLYYTPMGINRLRYIDLKDRSGTIYFFEDEPFGALSGPTDIPNQVTRMVFASDGKGYALTNNGEHLIQFTTKKKAVIRDLGAVTDDPSNGSNSFRSRSSYGGDMVADESGNLYLITANRMVFKINIESRNAVYLGKITGLPKGFTTNGAAVENGTSIIVCSSTNTSGYYKFDLNNLAAVKISGNSNVYNASDLANGNLISEKKKKDEKPETPEQTTTEPESNTVVKSEAVKQQPAAATKYKISVYPNPVVNDVAHLSFADFPEGEYEIRLMDLSGKIMRAGNVIISGKSQVHEFMMPRQIAKGNYLIKVTSESGKLMTAERIILE